MLLLEKVRHASFTRFLFPILYPALNISSAYFSFVSPYGLLGKTKLIAAITGLPPYPKPNIPISVIPSSYSLAAVDSAASPIPTITIL